MHSYLRNFLVTLCVGSSLVSVAMAGDSNMTYEQGQDLIRKVDDTLKLLTAWNMDNLQKQQQLAKFMEFDNNRTNEDHEFANRDAWNKVLDLNQNQLMLLEASYAFAKKTESSATLVHNSVYTKAWDECLQSDNCSFSKLNTLIDKEALELSSFTKDSAMDTQKNLMDSIDKLNELSLDSKNAPGLNSAIDTLSKVNSTQATALVSLTNQVSNLNKLTASSIQAKRQEDELRRKGDDLYYQGDNQVKSPHFDLSYTKY